MQLGAPVAPQIEPKGKGQLTRPGAKPARMDATYGAKGEGERKKEHVGYKIQVAETVSEAVLAPGEPTCKFLTGIVTHAAYQSDEAGSKLMDQEQAQMGMAKPPVQYGTGPMCRPKSGTGASRRAESIGPAQSAPRKSGRFSTGGF